MEVNYKFNFGDIVKIKGLEASRTFIISGGATYPTGNVYKCIDCEASSYWIEEEILITK